MTTPKETRFGRWEGYYSCITRKRNGVTYTVRIEPDNETSIDDDDVHPVERPDDVTDDTWRKLQDARAAYFADDWQYVGLVVSAERDGWERDYLASLWGLELNYPGNNGNDYLNVVAEELIEEAEDAIGFFDDDEEEEEEDVGLRLMEALREVLEEPGKPSWMRALLMIRDARDHCDNTYGTFPAFPFGPGPDQAFDDWSADVAVIALSIEAERLLQTGTVTLRIKE